MSFYFRQRWIDERLKYNNSHGVDVIELDTKIMEKIWVPDIYFVNEKQATMHDVTVPNKMMYLYPNGLVLYSARWNRNPSLFICLYIARNITICKNINLKRIIVKSVVKCMRGSRGGGGGGRDPPWNLQSLISPILLAMKKNCYFS